MFLLLRIIIWIAGFLFVAHFILGFFGYDLNADYFKKNQKSCQEQLLDCQKNLVHDGISGAKDNCNLQCVDPKLFIHKAK